MTSDACQIGTFLQRKTTAIWLSHGNKAFKTKRNGYLIFERLCAYYLYATRDTEIDVAILSMEYYLIP